MDVKLIKQSDEELELVIEADHALLNALRRSSFEIPILAIDEVEFFKNDSVLYDEIIAHRLGLIPLRALSIFIKQDECSCKGKGCRKCTTQISLEAKGPGMIYSGDLKCKGCEPVFKDMPLVWLEPNQELMFNATARLGTALELSLIHI